MTNEIGCCSEKMIEDKKNLKRLEEEMKTLGLKIEDSVFLLGDLKLRMEELKMIILDSEIVDVINVDDERSDQLSNGLVDLQRDILMKLVKMISDEKKFRNIVGMTKTFYDWSQQRIFRKMLPFPTERDYYKGCVRLFGKIAKPHGKGVCVRYGIETYDGDWVEGKREGKGKWTGISGDRYEGSWVNDKKEGKGLYMWSNDGTYTYEGDWVKGMFEGEGIKTRADLQSKAAEYFLYPLIRAH